MKKRKFSIEGLLKIVSGIAIFVAVTGIFIYLFWGAGHLFYFINSSMFPLSSFFDHITCWFTGLFTIFALVVVIGGLALFINNIIIPGIEWFIDTVFPEE
jgi:hypothetical protein